MTTPRWYMVDKMGMATLCTSKKDAEKEARDMDMAWPHMGPHRAVQLVDAADVEALHTGYAAARLEIESLRARGVAPDPRPVVAMCAKALAEELAAWDIDPPLHHVKEAHDACESWLAAIDAARAAQDGKSHGLKT